MSAAPGPLAEEAAKLLEAIGDWARGLTGGGSAHGESTDERSAAPEATAGVSASAPECQVCPICQLLALVRRTQPETFGHLAEASASVAAAVRTLVERHDHGGVPTSGVERIDLDEPDLGTWPDEGDDGARRATGAAT